MKKINAITGQGFSHPKASQKESFLFAGPLSSIFSSTKVTASDSAGVTVSMTSEDSAGYANLSSPESGSAKYRQRRSPMHGGLRTDNHLNEKSNSGFVQTKDKEKGPRPALRVMQLLTCEEANELHHNSYLQATGNLSYSRHQHPNKTGAGPASLNTEADISRFKERFFCVRDPRYAPIMVRRNGGASALAGFFCASLAAPIRLATLPASRLVRLQNLTEEAAAMVATTQTRPEFIDTYWIIPEYSTAPYGKVSFTRRDRRTFIVLFKDSRLIWAGRQPVKCFTQDVKRTESPKLPVKDPTTLTITNIVTVQGVAHV
ncbi:MAG: hypothetical protein EKE20_13790 [Candidatus Symbiopectobacterium sp. Dall1.0]|nr:hypothetical protein [Candidatus Symbiopectobacterium sp. Dall1.0]